MFQTTRKPQSLNVTNLMTFEGVLYLHKATASLYILMSARASERFQGRAWCWSVNIRAGWKRCQRVRWRAIYSKMITQNNINFATNKLAESIIHQHWDQFKRIQKDLRYFQSLGVLQPLLFSPFLHCRFSLSPFKVRLREATLNFIEKKSFRILSN